MAAKLVDRLRRLGTPGWRSARAEASGLAELEGRIEHLEAALEGLQDGVHRDAVRQNQELAELRHRTAPDEIARQLSDDARRRGI
jgi:hypothetical protein